jgi:hypothetical protein
MTENLEIPSEQTGISTMKYISVYNEMQHTCMLVYMMIFSIILQMQLTNDVKFNAL